MQWFKTELKDDYAIEMSYIDDNLTFIKQEIEKGKYSNYTPANKIKYNLNVTFEEFDAEYKRALEILKTKEKEVKKYFDSFKGKTVSENKAKFSVYKYGRVSNKFIANVPETISSKKDVKDLKKVINFKREKDTIYVGDIYRDIQMTCDDAFDIPKSVGYYIGTFKFTGLDNFQLTHTALSLAAYNKIGKICDFSNATLDNYQKVLDQEITLKGFIRDYLIID